MAQESTNSFMSLLLAGLLSGGVIATALSLATSRYQARTEETIRAEFAELSSQRLWKERSVSELLGPMRMQFGRTARAFARYDSTNIYLEAKILRDGNMAIRDLLLANGHLIPPELLDDADRLIEHYDVWLEEFERVRGGSEPDLQATFVYAGPKGFRFPGDAEDRFRDALLEYWTELYGL